MTVSPLFRYSRARADPPSRDSSTADLVSNATRPRPTTRVGLPSANALLDCSLTSPLAADIAQCAKVLRETAADEGLAPIPIFGNGDAYDYRTYYENMEATGVDGIMIARGALIKVSQWAPKSSRRLLADEVRSAAMALHRDQGEERLGHFVT